MNIQYRMKVGDKSRNVNGPFPFHFFFISVLAYHFGLN
jgi:hypothetical protein